MSLYVTLGMFNLDRSNQKGKISEIRFNGTSSCWLLKTTSIYLGLEKNPKLRGLSFWVTRQEGKQNAKSFYQWFTIFTFLACKYTHL